MSPYIEAPIGIGLIPCDTLIQDRITGKKSFIGVFDRISSSKFPLVSRPFYILVCLAGRNGTYPFSLELSSEKEGQVVFEAKGNVVMVSPTDGVDMVFPIQRVQFPTPGLYWIKFKIAGDTLMLRPIHVCRKAPPKEKEAN
ncbi:MAG: DUF6941 family protein [Oligosphaeraceae bacterium]